MSAPPAAAPSRGAGARPRPGRAAPRGPRDRPAARGVAAPGAIRSRAAVLAGAGTAALAAASVALHTGAMRSGYWIDEAIAVGMAGRPVARIPGTLLLDGSPPLYYVLLHAWTAVAGDGEAATRALSLLFALAAIPVALWAGRATLGPRAGWVAAAGAALCPFVGTYAQETRMYALVVVLSLVVVAGFVLAFVQGRDRHRWTFGVALVALLLTHNWGLFLGAACGIGWLVLWRRGTTPGRGVVVLVLAGVAYLPWLPSLLRQAAHTGAPWSSRPGAATLASAPVEVLGIAGTAAAVALGAVAALRGRGGRRDGAALPVLFALAAGTVLLAWVASQVSPAWAPRYLAVVAGPLLLGSAGLVARAGRPGLVVGAAVAVAWALTPLPAVKSNARTVALAVAPALRPGDVVVSTQPEQVPVLVRYLPRGLRWRTLTGAVADPRVTDWRDGPARLRATSVARDLAPVLDAMPPGRRLALVTPIGPPHRSSAPWMRAVRFRSVVWRDAVRGDPTLRLVAGAPVSAWPRRPSAVRIAVYEKRAPGDASRPSTGPPAPAGGIGRVRPVARPGR